MSALYCLGDITFDRSTIALFCYPSCISTADGGVPLCRSL